MQPIAGAIICAVLLSGALGLALLYRQAGAVGAHRGKVPAELAGKVSLAEHRRAADYMLARVRLAAVKSVFETSLALAWLMVFLAVLYGWVAGFIAPGLSRSVALVVAFAAIERLAQLPFEMFATFSLEARFGFNRATPAMFVIDKLKGAAISAVLGIPSLYGLFWLIRVMPHLWWLPAWAAFMGVAIVMSFIFPAFIAPLFNKFKPLPEGELKTRAEALLAKCGFESKGVYVMDASKRSTHGNAYFTGFGRAKRIVFFDTLLEHHTGDEILAVLAHELGHFKLGHIAQRIGLLAAASFAGFAILSWVFASGEPAAAFGLPRDQGLLLILAAIAAAPVLRLLSPLTSWLSRRAEYQADAFAKAVTGPPALISALAKLARDNLSTLTPDALYAAFYYSHPPVPERIARLRG